MLRKVKCFGFYLLLCITTTVTANMPASFDRAAKEFESVDFDTTSKTFVTLCCKNNRADPLFIQDYGVLMSDDIELALLKQIETHQLLQEGSSKLDTFYRAFRLYGDLGSLNPKKRLEIPQVLTHSYEGPFSLLGQFSEPFDLNSVTVENDTSHRTITRLREIKGTILEMVKKEAVPSLADFILGQLMLEWGHNSRKNNQLVFSYLKNVEGLKYAPALYALANCYELGIGCSHNMDYCINLLKQAADLGHLPAQYQLATMGWSYDILVEKFRSRGK